MSWWNKSKYKKPEPFSDRDKHQRFYQTPAWQRTRLYVLSLTPFCVNCLKNGMTVAGEEVDHIISLTENYSLRLDFFNLQVLCKICHSKKTRHEVKERKEREKDKLTTEFMSQLNIFDDDE
jgi:5-methylcytosine-specific restriction enzyme A